MAANIDKKPGKFICSFCGDTYTREAMFNKHVKECPDNPSNGGDPKESLNMDLVTEPVPPKDPSKMSEIEKLEYELAKKKAEAARLEAEKKKVEETKQSGLESRGIVAEPETIGKFRLVQIRNHVKLPSVFNDMDAEGFDFIQGFTFSTGIIYLMFKKR